MLFYFNNDEKEETFLEIFKVLREEPYHMNPLYMM